jgi:choline dehydrogenase-like flavoprotein
LNQEPDFLVLPTSPGDSIWERERIYGGTSAHWGGQCRPQDPIDLEERSGFPGWHISRDDLDPYYAEASALCNLHGDYNLHGDNFSAEYWAGVLQAQIPTLEGFDVEMYQFVGQSYKNFAVRTFDGGITIGESPVDVILNASLLNIVHQQGNVSNLHVASMDDTPKKATEFTIKADAYVLACGAVANARQLLLSKAGNEYDQVGRYFMCHPYSPNTPSNAYSYLNASQARLINGEPAGARPGVKWTDSNGVGVSGRFIPNAAQTRKLGIGRCWFSSDGGAVYFEMAPNPESRVTLSEKCDPVFGQRQTRIDWRLSDLDKTTYEKTTELFKTAVEKLGGQTSFYSWDDVKSQLTINGHHIGTTRMLNDPTKGVVNSDLKVHSLDNLYVAGASVFPTAGISNPTFTIIMLSIRLADHLRKTLSH